MKPLVLALALSAAAPAPPPPAHDVDGIERTKAAAYAEEQFAFCTDPTRPLGPRQKRLCTVAKEIPDCPGLVSACDLEPTAPPPDWLARLAQWAAPFATVLLYLLVAAIVIVVAIPVVGALLQLRRRKKRAAEATAAPNVATIVAGAPAAIPDDADPEEALRLAEESLARGDHRASLALSLAAALAALGRRGAIKIARHRTHGEYVRSCAEETARPPLREIVRAVDAVEFGGAEATGEAATRITARARAIVRTAAVVTTLGLLLLGCKPPQRGADPAGDELPIAILAKNGFTVKPLASSLSTMPVPSRGEGAPVVVVDVERVPLDDETEAHLMRWVEGGGVLVLFGSVIAWPSELAPHAVRATTRDLFVSTPDPNGGLEDPDTDQSPDDVGRPIHFAGARVARHDAFAWKDRVAADPVAFLGRDVYASKRRLGRGLVLGVANDDLWTNVGVMPTRNAAALVTLIRSVSHDLRRPLGGVTLSDLRVARAEDGIPPPSNPFAALLAAGLGKGAWHALAAAVLLFLCYGIRHARPRAAPTKPRRSFTEHVEATGAFYARARARTHALAQYGRFMELRLRELAPRGTDPTAFLAQRSGASPERAAELYTRALAAKPDELPKGDELELLGELRTMMAKATAPRRS
ncbi:MAG: hypothetical protein KIT84_01535 [Labilithrix sp.]|nr:hypothetical protein [Labilithrix sp.]MCW5809669.1 hypothetical protein [Labilithrix sp.]